MGDAETIQCPLGDVTARDWDTLIVGAGPAGSTAAICLARQGHQVLLIDRAAFPRRKICGDGLMPDSLATLGRLGLENQVRKLGRIHTRTRVISPGGIEFPIRGDYVTLQREILDMLLAQAAVAAGVTFAQGNVHALEVQRDRSVQLPGPPITAKSALIATGCSLRIPAAHGMVTQREATAFAATRYVRSSFRLEDMTIILDRNLLPGYGWVFPMGDDLYNVGCGSGFPCHGRPNYREQLRNFCTTNPLVKELMSKARGQTPDQVAPLRCGLRGVNPVGPGRMLAVGECIGTTYPCTGEGIGKAMETAELAAQLLSQSLKADDPVPLATYPAELETRFRKRFKAYESAQWWLGFPRLNDIMARRTQRSAKLQEMASDLVHERIQPDELFSITGLLRALFLRS